MRLFLLGIVLAALAANPCFAKDGHSHSHAQHGVSVTGAHNGASGKDANGSGARGVRGASGLNPAPSKADVPLDAGAIVAPPVLPPHGVTQQQIRIINPSVKTANPANSSRSQAGATPMTLSTARNAIGQPIASPRNSPGAQAPLPALQSPAGVTPAIIHAGPAAPPVLLGTARVNVANVTNRGSVNGATVIRPANGASVIGGPAQARYGINGTTVQNKH